MMIKNMENVEIEIQIKIENSKNLLKFLKKNADFKYENKQIDEYFTPSHRDFLKTRPVGEWLRLRDSGGNFSINYKNWHFYRNGKSYYCDEYESKIENIGKVKKIFKVLDFKSLVVVEKVRKAWQYKNYEIALDSIKNLGDFVEIEYVGKRKVDPETTTAEMIKFLKDIGCGKIERNYVGYPFQLLFPEEVKWEKQ